MYISCIKRLISNKWRQDMIRLSQKFYVQLFLTNKTQVMYIIWVLCISFVCISFVWKIYKWCKISLHYLDS